MKRLLTIFAAVLLLAPGAFAADVRILKIDSAALRGNLAGDPAVQSFAVYVPPGYDSSTARYPVVYLLHGIADSYETWTGGWKIPDMLDRLIAAKAIAPMIVVMPNAGNRFMGSYYVNSPVTGRWADMIANEMVAMVDAQFRTLAKPESRGVVGHSMGGYGAIRFGMERPDVFRAVYALSPCCLDAVEDIGWANQAMWRTFLNFKSYADAEAALQKGDFYPMAALGLLSAHLPNPDAPLRVDVPIRAARGELVPNEPAYTKLRDQLPMRNVGRYRENLRQLRMLSIDYGFADKFAHIPVATPAFSRELIAHGVPHVLDAYEGDHRQRVVRRMETIVFPTFSAVLAKE
ncbi:MAG TPA: alpha/beta hydrolase-fold protein [Thermoanaerobaculia bacterium]|nr:alpha/beta hydrolase-fold protein [Thermoanaerobaculia bacterium]